LRHWQTFLFLLRVQFRGFDCKAQIIINDVERQLSETVSSNNPPLENNLLVLRSMKFVQIAPKYLFPLKKEPHLYYRYKLVNII